MFEILYIKYVLMISKQKVNELSLHVSREPRHIVLRIPAAVLPQAHQLTGIEAFLYAHHSTAAYCGLLKKNKGNFTVSHGSLQNIFPLFEFRFT